MTTMKAIRIHAYGGVENLHYDEVLRPEPQAGQVLVRVHAAGVNPFAKRRLCLIDWKIREGYFKQTIDLPLPVIIGQDIAGVVAAVGSGVTTLQPGQDVYGIADLQLSGAYAEYALCYAEAIAPKPHTLDYIHAAAVPLAAMTAWQALFDKADLHSGQTLLIHGGAGGVGGYAIQLAKLKGARVIATAAVEHTVEKTFELEAAAAAQEFSQYGHPYGKLVLQVTH
jgi:NADPH:quinone reductase-like Zn-dependent oxidoreductase